MCQLTQGKTYMGMGEVDEAAASVSQVLSGSAPDIDSSTSFTFVSLVYFVEMSDTERLARDLNLTNVVLSVYFRYLDVLIFVHTVLFVTVMYILKSLYSSSKLSEYRLCLLANNVSVYLFEFFVFLGKPSLLPSGIYVPSQGVIAELGPRAGFYNIYFIFLFLIAHLTALGLSIAFQYGVAASTGWVKLIFRSSTNFWLTFSTIVAALTTIVWVVLALIGKENALEGLDRDKPDEAMMATFLQRFK